MIRVSTLAAPSGPTGRRRRARLGVALAAIVVSVASGACGSNDKAARTSAPTSSAAGSEATPAATTAVGKATPITNYVQYTGGTAGAAKSGESPITIGWINTQGGSDISFPAATIGAQAAVKYVTAKLGGVQGHPVRLKTCYIVQSEEEGQACAQKMLNDKQVDVILFGLVAVGAQPIFSTVNGAKPIIIGSPADPSATKAQNTYSLSGTENAVFGPWATFAVDKLKAKKVAVIYPEGPAALTGAAAIKAGLKRAGAQVTSVGFAPTSNDLLGPLTAAGGQSSDAVVPVADGPNCIKIAKALQQIGSKVPVISVPNCLDPSVAKALGDFPKWYYGIAATIAGDGSAPDVKAYRAASSQYGLSTEQSFDPFAQLAWGEVLLTVKLMNTIGADKVTPSAIAKAITAYRGSYPMGPPSLACHSSPPSEPSSCNDETQFYQYTGKGQFKLAAAWLPGR